MARIIIVGSGVVGTATGKGFLSHGHNVTFIDVLPARISALRAEGLDATDVIDLSGPPATVFLTLPTPHRGFHYDMSAFMAGTRAVGRALALASSFHTIVVRSTVTPGTCEGIVQPALEEASGKKAGEGFSLASNPEFLRAACAYEDFINPWMTIIASRSRRTVERLEALLRPFGGEFRTFSNPATSEMIKCCHNIFNATKISFWNEMWEVARRLGISADDVAETVARSSEGSINPSYGIRGGAPYGGACLPKDTNGFVGFAAAMGLEMPLLRAVIEVNDAIDQRLNSELSNIDGELVENTRPLMIDLVDSVPSNGNGSKNGNGAKPEPGVSPSTALPA
jgi:UDPglucose 6-dehydrogenase